MNATAHVTTFTAASYIAALASLSENAVLVLGFAGATLERGEDLPSVPDTGKALAIGKSTVGNALKELVDKGLLQRKPDTLSALGRAAVASIAAADKAPTADADLVEMDGGERRSPSLDSNGFSTGAIAGDHGGELQYIAVADLDACPLNPRTIFDAGEIAALADSILAQGLLQNLVARPSPENRTDDEVGDLVRFEVIAGNRRLRALHKLADDGRIDADSYIVPVLVRDLSDDQVLFAAMTENLQRENLSPMDEANAFRAYCDRADGDGRATARIAEAIGMSRRYVQKRLRLSTSLTPEAQGALVAGTISLDHAQVLTMASRELQAECLDEIAQGYGWDAGDSRDRLALESPLVGQALFDLALYDGIILDANGDTAIENGKAIAPLLYGEGYFEDMVQYRRLQAAAIDAKEAELAGQYAWVKRIAKRDYADGESSNYQRVSPDDPRAGALIIYDTALTVQIRVDYIDLRDAGKGKADTDADTNTGTTTTEPAVKLPSATVTGKTIILCQGEKTKALQRAIAHPNIGHGHMEAVAMALVILPLLHRYGAGEVKISADPFSPDDMAPDGHPALIADTKALLAPLAKAGALKITGDGWRTDSVDDAATFRWLTANPGHCAEIFQHLVARQVGCWPGYQPTLGDSELTLAIAEATGAQADSPVDTPRDLTEFLGMFRLPRLQAMAHGVTATHHSDLCGDPTRPKSKAELVTELAGQLPVGWIPPELTFADRAGMIAAIDGGGDAAPKPKTEATAKP